MHKCSCNPYSRYNFHLINSFWMRCKGVHGKQNLVCMAMPVNYICLYMFYTAVWPMCLVAIQNTEDGEPEIVDFGANLHGIESTQMANKMQSLPYCEW